MGFDKQYKAVLIDFDGTLADSMTVLWNCYRIFLSRYGVKAKKSDFVTFVGPSIPIVVKILKERYNLSPSMPALIHEYQLLVQELYQEEVALFPYAKETIQLLRMQGKKIAMVTAAQLPLVSKHVKKWGIESLFDKIVTNNLNEPAKPDPAIYLRALHLLQLEPSDAIAIEDSPAGVESACRAGIPTIRITTWKEFEQNPPLVVFEAKNWKAIGSYLLE